MFNVGLAAGMFRAAGELAVSAPTSEPVPTAVPGMRSTVVRAPLGVCVGIAPWNAPVILGTRAIVWAAGAWQHRRLQGLRALAAHPRRDRRGARRRRRPGRSRQPAHQRRRRRGRGGRRPGRAPADRPHQLHRLDPGGPDHRRSARTALKPTLLELGGKAPLVVLDDADLEAAAAATGFGAFMNSGQICMSTERVVVDLAVKDEFERLLTERAASLPTGDPLRPGHGDRAAGRRGRAPPASPS